LIIQLYSRMYNYLVEWSQAVGVTPKYLRF